MECLNTYRGKKVGEMEGREAMKKTEGGRNGDEEMWTGEKVVRRNNRGLFRWTSKLKESKSAPKLMTKVPQSCPNSRITCQNNQESWLSQLSEYLM